MKKVQVELTDEEARIAFRALSYAEMKNRQIAYATSSKSVREASHRDSSLLRSVVEKLSNAALGSALDDH